MLSDPQSVTYDGVVKTLPVTGVKPPNIKGLMSSRSYTTSDGEFRLFTRRYSMSDGSFKTEVELQRRKARDLDGDTNTDDILTNGFGITVSTNPYVKDSNIEVPLLRSALLALATDPFVARLVGGEH